WHSHCFQPLGIPSELRGVLQKPVRLARMQVPQFLNHDWPQLAANGCKTNFKITDFTLEPQKPRFLLELNGGLSQLTGRLQCAYGSRIMTPGVTSAEETIWLPDPESHKRYLTRDTAAEQAALGRLQRSGFSRPNETGKMQLLGQNGVLNFFARDFQSI